MAETPPMRFRIEVDPEPAMTTFRSLLAGLEDLMAYLENPSFKVIPLKDEEASE